MQSTLTSKGQITIPSALRRKLHLKTGDVLDFDENVSFLKATKQVNEKRMRLVLGRGKRKLQGKTSQEWLEDLRGPVEFP